jgi:hypothetical protein
MTPIRVGLNRVLAGLMLAVSGLNLVVFLMAANTMQLLLAGVLGGVGLMYLFGDAFVVTATEVQVKNPLGMILKRYPIRSLADLRFDGGTLYVAQGEGGERKIGSFKLSANGSDLAKLRQAVDDARAAAAPKA